MSLPTFRKTDTIPKGWGEEVVLANSPKYCGKLLCFKAGARFSMHFHDLKEESFYVLRGTIRFDWIDPQTAKECSRTMILGEVVDIPRLCFHRVSALTDAVLVEVSTHHQDADSYRVAPGDTQR